jgi:hypothetical protein
MAIVVAPFEAHRTAAVEAFNRRLADAGSRWRFPEQPRPRWLAPIEGSATYQQFLLAIEGAHVRGGYALQRRPAGVGDETLPLENWYLVVSEGSVDPCHSLVGSLLVRDALLRAPLSFCLGMSGVGSPLARIADRFGCRPRVVPFFARIESGSRVARQARYLRQRRALAGLLDLAAATGAAALGAAIVKATALRSRCAGAGVEVEAIDEFGAAADALWADCRAHYSFVGARDAATLNRVYPRERPRLQRLVVSRQGAAIGWAVLQSACMSGNPHFGDLHVGRITDVFAAPQDAHAVIHAAVERLAALGVELMLSNQSHPAWCDALRAHAFLEAPSTFAFAASPGLAARIHACDPDGRRLHLNRGDGDGPWGHDPVSF